MNDSRRPDPRKDACDELAERLATDDGLRTVRLLQVAGALGATPGETALNERTDALDGPRPISIWQPREVQGSLRFVRPEPGPFGDHYAARRELLPEKPAGSTRIAFFGESVAAGYLYAPHLTPAGVLEQQLAAVAAAGRYEVVDLARTNETLEPLVETVAGSLQLSPDVLVIFAGNNWSLLEPPETSPYAPTVGARQRAAQALRRGGLGALAALSRRQLEKKAEAAFAEIHRLADGAGIPVILVIPEVNMADWENRQPVPWLPGDGSARWYEHYRHAVEHLGQQRWQEAERAARAMLELDGGVCGTAYRLLAMALCGQGRRPEALQACRGEVDATTIASICFLGAPQATTPTRRILRRAAERHGFALVDLPDVFAGDTPQALPGRRLFLDYCHLSREGMDLAMAAVARAVWRAAGDGGRAAPRDELATLAPAAEATALLGAAIHSAHRLLTVGPRLLLLEHGCRRALAADPAIAAAMLDLIEARCAPCPAVLTAAQQRNLASPHRLLLQHGWRWDFLDAELLEALCEVLEETGHPARETLTGLLLRYHGVGGEGRELARAPYLWEPLERFYPEVMTFTDLPRRATLRCPWPETGFCLITDARGDLELDLTLRLPLPPGVAGQRRGEVEVAVGGEPVATLPAGETWRRHRPRLPRRLLRPGLQRLALRWPPLPAIGDDARQAAIERLELGREAELHPVFGEVFSLSACQSGA